MLRPLTMALCLLACGTSPPTPAAPVGGRIAVNTRDPDAASTDLHSALDLTVPALLAAKRVSSASIALIDHGRVSVVAAYGEQAPGEQATPRTLYNIASLSKPLSAE